MAQKPQRWTSAFSASSSSSSRRDKASSASGCSCRRAFAYEIAQVRSSSAQIRFRDVCSAIWMAKLVLPLKVGPMTTACTAMRGMLGRLGGGGSGSRTVFMATRTSPRSVASDASVSRTSGAKSRGPARMPAPSHGTARAALCSRRRCSATPASSRH
eukprot:scaffold1661_cov251-Pinguiococcus_pyrenoidosus.AAC.58